MAAALHTVPTHVWALAAPVEIQTCQDDEALPPSPHSPLPHPSHNVFLVPLPPDPPPYSPTCARRAATVGMAPPPGADLGVAGALLLWL